MKFDLVKATFIWFNLIMDLQGSDISYPGRYEEGHHMSEREEDVGDGSRGSCFNKSSPERLVAISLAFLVVKAFILLWFMAMVTPGSVLRLAQEPQPVPGARAPHYPSCRSSRPL